MPGTEFNATGPLRCAMQAGEPMEPACTFGVIRQGDGAADVTVTRPDGRKRVIFFKNGAAFGYDENEADPGGPLSSTRDGDTSIVSIGTERYEIVDAMLFGG